MRSRLWFILLTTAALLSAAPATEPRPAQTGAATLQTPAAFLGYQVGADGKLARWDTILAYLKQVDLASDRIEVRELGRTTLGQPFVSVEISSAENLTHRDRYRSLQRRLYFQDGEPSPAQRDEIFAAGKAVVVITCNLHATEIGASQMALDLVYRLATDNSPQVRHVLDNVILLLVPSANPDGQRMVVDWYNKNAGTPFEASPLPWLNHPYAGHDNNRDMYMFTQVESRLVAGLLWRDWFPMIWLDEHQQGSGGARIFVMPATDPINPNVHPLIYRWNGILGQRQGAALEAAGKYGIIYNATYTNYWQGAMAWSGWWHNQVGLLTEVASARVATPVEQQMAEPGRSAPAPPPDDYQAESRRQMDHPNEPLPPPRDVTPRTEYPRPWLGGRWTLGDIVDYERIATLALLEAVADSRETLLRNIYEVNRATIEEGRKGNPSAILISPGDSFDPQAAGRLVARLQIAGVTVWRADAAFKADAREFPAGTFVVPLAQVFGRYAKDILEKQVYPEVRRTPSSPPEAPYDVTGWSLGMLMGAEVTFVKSPLGNGVPLSRVTSAPGSAGSVTGTGTRFVFDYRGPQAAVAINRLLKQGAHVAFLQEAGGTVVEVGATPHITVNSIAASLGLNVRSDNRRPAAGATPVKAPRLGLYQSWTANMDEGWTRWVLEQHEFGYTTLHNADVKAGRLRERFDVVVIPDQPVGSILRGNDAASIRPEYRGGIGDEGLAALREFVSGGGTIITMGSACDLAIEKFALPVRNIKRDYTRDQHFAPGTVVRIEVDRASALGRGMPAVTRGFYVNSPLFAVVEGFASQKVSVAVRYPNTEVVASGWLRGEELMAGRAAVVTVDTNPGHLVLFGLRPQYRAQTEATFPLLFNALYASVR
jgi:hypothetical protein